MKIFIETQRLILREIVAADKQYILQLDSDPEVLRYLPVPVMRTLEEAEITIDYIRKQYKENGIGRWAVILKQSNDFVGWCGIKLVNDSVVNGQSNFYDLGFRLLEKHWNKGFATEAARACIDYAFNEMDLKEIHATVMFGNLASCHVLEKLGMTKKEDFLDESGLICDWYTLARIREKVDGSI